MWGFIWNLILVTFGTKYRFEYQNIISFVSTQWHSFSGLHTTLFFKWILPEVIKKMFLILLRLFWIWSYDYKGYFWVETLFEVIFGPNIDLTNQLHALPMVKTLNGKIFTWAPFLPIYEIYFLLLLHEKLVTFLNLHFVAKKSSSELRIIFFFLYLR